MKINKIYYCIIILTCVILSILWVSGVFNCESYSKSDTKSKCKCNPSYISPVPFKTGYVDKSSLRNKTSNLCRNDGVLYPINPSYVNYGPTPDYNKENCDNLVFNAVP